MTTDPDELAVAVAKLMWQAGLKPTIKLARNIMGETIAIEVWRGPMRVASFDCTPAKMPATLAAALNLAARR